MGGSPYLNLMRNVVIIGSGCAGNTAAIYAARANLKPLVVGGHEPGGQLSITSLVENFPGFPEGVNGPDLVENMKKQAEHFGAEYVYGSVTAVDFSKRPFRLDIDGEWHETRTVIIASGASARWLNLPSEQKLIGHGVSSLRHVRRLLLSRQENNGDRRRRLRHGRGKLPDTIRRRSNPCPPSGCVPRIENHGGPHGLQPKDQDANEHRRR